MKLPMLVAEVGSVHDGSFGNAQKLIELAAHCGANAVKFQTHISEAETLEDAPSPSYFKNESRSSYFERTGFSRNSWKKLAKHAEACGITFLSSPFSLEAVDLLEEIGITAYKIPSGEVNNLPLLEKVADLGKPVFLSSGMSNWEELDQAMNTLRNLETLAVMQCTSLYPCPPDKVGINIIDEISSRYPNAIPGYSDHTLSPAAAIAAAARGALIIEKHLTFSKHMYGSDAIHSMEPNEFSNLAEWLGETWEMTSSTVNKNAHSDKILEMKKIFEKSIVTSKALPKGKKLNRRDIAFKKPGDGIPAKDYRQVIGKKIDRDIDASQKLSWDVLK